MERWMDKRGLTVYTQLCFMHNAFEGRGLYSKIKNKCLKNQVYMYLVQNMFHFDTGFGP